MMEKLKVEEDEKIKWVCEKQCSGKRYM